LNLLVISGADGLWVWLFPIQTRFPITTALAELVVITGASLSFDEVLICSMLVLGVRDGTTLQTGL
jgi:hypothetical protein